MAEQQVDTTILDKGCCGGAKLASLAQPAAAHGRDWASNRLRQSAIGPSLAVSAFADSTYVLNGRVDELALYQRLLTAEERAWLSRNNGQGRACTENFSPQR